jgi:anti-sigma regulatory factor (Ser/Thr protein kinase)
MTGIQQRLPARPSSVPQARRAIAEFMRLHSSQPAAMILDIGLGVTEACANVVRHAYPDGGGEVEVEATLVDGDLVVCVSDVGVGFQHATPQPGAGLGVPLMERLASTTIQSRPGCTRVRMRFALARSPASAPG